jgi:hypothetical protein
LGSIQSGQSGEVPLTDAVDQAQRDVDEALAVAEAALRAAVEALARLRALAGSGAATQQGYMADFSPNSVPANLEADPEPEWLHVDQAADELGVSPSTVRRWAEEYGARWPHGCAQRVNFGKLRHLRPPRAKNEKNEKNEK